MRRRSALLAAGLGAAGLILQGCAAKPVPYGPIGEEAPHGYEDWQNPDGGFTVRVAMPGMSAPSELRAFFDRRANELCPAGVERTNIFNMTRQIDNIPATYVQGGVSMGSRYARGTELEGYVYCKSDPNAAPADVAKVEPAPEADAVAEAEAAPEPGAAPASDQP